MDLVHAKRNVHRDFQEAIKDDQQSLKAQEHCYQDEPVPGDKAKEGLEEAVLLLKKQAEMRLAGQLGRIALGLACVIWTAVPVFLWSDFKLAYVTEHSLYMCSCVHGLIPCGVINSSQCSCKDLSALRHGDGSGAVRAKRLTVWYTSPLNVALLLNNSEVRHLSLVRCKSPGGRGGSYQYFSVQQLERLTVSHWQAELGHSMELGKDLGPHTEEARLAVIHTSVLTGKAALKAYTVRATADAHGVLPFPNMCMSPAGLPATATMFVTFLY